MNVSKSKFAERTLIRDLYSEYVLSQQTKHKQTHKL